MKVLITGAAGFLGSALGAHLIRQGHEVRGLDDLSTGKEEAVHEDVLFTRGDVMDRPKLWTLLQDVECVFHLAARVSVQESILYPREYNETNVGGTVSLMEAMRDVGVRRVVFTSSGAVYGSQKKQPLSEDLRPHPDSPYAVSKLSAEYYVRTIGKLWEIETVTLRIFNAYGQGQHLPPAHPPVIPNYLKQAVQEGTLVIHNSGDQTRDFVYVDDVVRAMSRAASADEVDGEIINVGSGTEVSVTELADLVLEVTDGEPEVVHNPKSDGGVKRMRADITRARELLDYEPQISLREGLRLTLKRDPRF
ncbi:MAG: NAD-dependent epimerase/dehydratase family protein [Anaerolineales bacterium]|nr:NAD-dependent epimerase/dehydratase family protein [Anaerolineales bacterium]MBS3752345.1 NAD-dependent epimerase/dehydratase family protein [Anaerolineales bacterium]